MSAKQCTEPTRRARPGKGEQFREAAAIIETLVDEKDLIDAYVTLCVHAGIAAADVIRCARPGQHSSGPGHEEANRAAAPSRCTTGSRAEDSPSPRERGGAAKARGRQRAAPVVRTRPPIRGRPVHHHPVEPPAEGNQDSGGFRTRDLRPYAGLVTAACRGFARVSACQQRRAGSPTSRTARREPGGCGAGTDRPRTH